MVHVESQRKCFPIIILQNIWVEYQYQYYSEWIEIFLLQNRQQPSAMLSGIFKTNSQIQLMFGSQKNDITTRPCCYCFSEVNDARLQRNISRLSIMNIGGNVGQKVGRNCTISQWVTKSKEYRVQIFTPCVTMPCVTSRPV